MNLRPTQTSTYNLIKHGLSFNFAKLVRAQEQVASGKRILRPSDDPIGTSQALSLRRQIAGTERYTGAVADARTLLDSGASALEDGATLLSNARAVLIQGMNGTQSPQDRQLLAGELADIRGQLLDIANRQVGNRFLFAGTEIHTKPYSDGQNGGTVYRGNADGLRYQVGLGTTVAANIPGAEIFGRIAPGQTSYTSLTGVARGQTVDQGRSYDYLEVRHESTSGVLGAGLAFVGGGAQDTIMGDHVLTVDGSAGTVQLDGGAAVQIPAPGSPDVADFVVTDSHGAELHLDFSGYAGGDVISTITGNGSASLDGVNYVALDFLDQDLQLTDAATGAILHIDTTGIHRAGSDLVTFGGTVDIFDVLQGAVEDLQNAQGLAAADVVERLSARLGEFDRNQQNLIGALGTLGSRSASLTALGNRLEDAAVHARGLLSKVEDADYGEVVLEMSAAQTTLETTQATAARLIQSTLLNFLR